MNRIREIRKAKGMTLKQVAEACDPKASDVTIGRLERGERRITKEWIDTLSVALECHPTDIFPDLANERTPEQNRPSPKQALETLVDNFKDDPTILDILDVLKKKAGIKK